MEKNSNKEFKTTTLSAEVAISKQDRDWNGLCSGDA